MRINPLSKTTNEASSKEAVDQVVTNDKDSARKTGEALAVKDESSAVPHFESIKSTADLKRIKVSENKGMNADLIKTARKTLKAISFDSKIPDKTFIEANLEQPGSDPKYGEARLNVKMSGELAAKKLFKTGIIHKLFGWVPRLFGYANSSIGNKWLSKKSGINFYDPTSKHSHIDDPKRVRDLLKSGRYAVSVTYKAGKNGKFTKEPEAIVLIDCMYKVIDEMKVKAKHAPKEVRERLEERISRLNSEELNSYAMINSALINPKSKANYDKESSESLGHRERLLSSTIESLEEHTSFIVPSPVFADKDASTGKYQYDQIPNMNFLYANKKDNETGLFETTATLARNPQIHKSKVPENDMVDLMTLAMISEHLAKPLKMNSGLGKKMSEFVTKMEAKNVKAWTAFNQRLGFNYSPGVVSRHSTKFN